MRGTIPRGAPGILREMDLRRVTFHSIAIAFTTFAVLKFAGGHNDAFLLSAPVYYGMAVLELGMAAWIWSGGRVAPCAMGAAIGTGGVILALLHPDETCGCFGIYVRGGPVLHVVLGVAFKALCEFGLFLQLRRSATK